MAADAGQSAGEGLVELPLEELVADSLAGLAQAPHIAVELDGAAGKRIQVARRAVAQALGSLLVNAQDATPAGGEVQLRAAALADGVRIEVCDRGCGMEPAVLTRAGEPFFTTKAPGRGMGL